MLTNKYKGIPFPLQIFGKVQQSLPGLSRSKTTHILYQSYVRRLNRGAMTLPYNEYIIVLNNVLKGIRG